MTKNAPCENEAMTWIKIVELHQAALRRQAALYGFASTDAGSSEAICFDDASREVMQRAEVYM